ncbi:hypothetical protein [Roseovarius sp. TE539]|nr:hypothetical protein [Roseovarius sp. TE539]
MTKLSRPSAAAAHPRVRRPGFGPEDLTDNEVAWFTVRKSSGEHV